MSFSALRAIAARLASHPRILGKPISQFSEHLLRDICVEARLPSAIVTSVKRTVEDQAGIFYRKHVVEGKKANYANKGVAPIIKHARELHAAKKTKEEVISYLISSIRDVHGGPGSISRHLGEQPFLEIFDVAHYSGPTSGKERHNYMTSEQAQAFLKACRARMPSTILRLGHSAELGMKVKGEFVDEKCFHLEVRQPVFDKIEQPSDTTTA